MAARIAWAFNTKTFWNTRPPVQQIWAGGFSFLAFQPSRLSEGEFSNIRNLPVLQVKKFAAVPARYIRLVSEGDIHGAKQLAIAELGVITR